MRILRTIRLLLLSCWIGGGIFLVAVAAPAAFRHSSRSTAAEIVGAMLQVWHYMAIVVPLVLLVGELRRRNGSRSGAILLLTGILLFASIEIAVDLRLHSIRRDLAVPMDSLSLSHPIRARFGRLHGISSSLLLLQLLAGIGLLAYEQRESPHAPSSHL